MNTQRTPPEPSPNGRQTGRDSQGRFAKGNPGGPGNPYAAEVGRHRAQLLKSIRESDVELAITVIRRIMRSRTAKDTDALAAARELLDRTVGRSVQADLLERVEALERTLLEKP